MTEEEIYRAPDLLLIIKYNSTCNEIINTYSRIEVVEHIPFTTTKEKKLIRSETLRT